MSIIYRAVVAILALWGDSLSETLSLAKGYSLLSIPGSWAYSDNDCRCVGAVRESKEGWFSFLNIWIEKRAGLQVELYFLSDTPYEDGGFWLLSVYSTVKSMNNGNPSMQDDKHKVWVWWEVSPGGSVVSNLPMQKMQLPSLGKEDPVEKEIATLSVTWSVPWRGAWWYSCAPIRSLQESQMKQQLQQQESSLGSTLGSKCCVLSLR